MIIVNSSFNNTKTKRNFLDTDSFIYFIFDEITKDILIVLYNRLTDSKIAYDISNCGLLKNYKLFNKAFFTIPVNELSSQYFDYFIVCKKTEEIIYQGDFFIKKNILYNLLGFALPITLNHTGTYFESFA